LCASNHQDATSLDGGKSWLQEPGSPTRGFHAKFEVLLKSGSRQDAFGRDAAAYEADCEAHVTAHPGFLEALRRALPDLFAAADAAAPPALRAGAGGTASAALSPAVSQAVAAAAAAAASESPLTLWTATHVVFGGCFYPLLRDANNNPMILAPNHTSADALQGVGMRLLRLTPCGSGDERIRQLRALGSLVGDAQVLHPRKMLFDKTPVLKGGARLHAVLPNGDLGPVMIDDGYSRYLEDYWLAAPRMTVAGRVVTCEACPEPVRDVVGKLPYGAFHAVYLA
jgi:hypothetical protein